MDDKVDNSLRVEHAQVAMDAFVERVGQDDDEDTLVDLIADLIHWADTKEIFFDDVVLKARRHYNVEIGEEPEPEYDSGWPN